jgi:secondary thiamine-phosphate synthase enzyme
MVVTHKKLHLKTRGESDILDITHEVQEKVSESKVKNGIAVVFVLGSTAGITTMEYEPGLTKDLPDMFEKIAPRKLNYAHNARWGDDNGYSHVRASLLGPSLVVPVVDGTVQLGTWQQIVLVDFDNRPRGREVAVQVLGE